MTKSCFFFFFFYYYYYYYYYCKLQTWKASQWMDNYPFNPGYILDESSKVYWSSRESNVTHKGEKNTKKKLTHVSIFFNFIFVQRSIYCFEKSSGLRLVDRKILRTEGSNRLFDARGYFNCYCYCYLNWKIYKYRINGILYLFLPTWKKIMYWKVKARDAEVTTNASVFIIGTHYTSFFKISTLNNCKSYTVKEKQKWKRKWKQKKI